MMRRRFDEITESCVDRLKTLFEPLGFVIDWQPSPIAEMVNEIRVTFDVKQKGHAAQDQRFGSVIEVDARNPSFNSPDYLDRWPKIIAVDLLRTLFEKFLPAKPIERVEPNAVVSRTG